MVSVLIMLIGTLRSKCEDANECFKVSVTAMASTWVSLAVASIIQLVPCPPQATASFKHVVCISQFNDAHMWSLASGLALISQRRNSGNWEEEGLGPLSQSQPDLNP